MNKNGSKPTMKKITVIGLSLSLAVTSLSSIAEHNLSIGYTRINQKLFDAIDLQQDGATIGYARYWNTGLGIRANVSSSLETGNTLYEEGRFLTNKTNAMYQIQASFRYPVTDNFSLVAAYGLTEYHTTWRVNGVEPSWSKGTDSAKGAAYGFQYDFANESTMWEVMAGKPYDKMKEGFGREETYIITSNFVYKF